MSEMVEVTADVQAQRQAEERQQDYEYKQSVRGAATRGLTLDGNPVTVQEILDGLERSRAAQHQIAAEREEAEAAQALERRLQEERDMHAREQAGRDAEAALKEYYRKNWKYSNALFEARWPDILAEHVKTEARQQAEEGSDAAYLARKRAEMHYI